MIITLFLLIFTISYGQHSNYKSLKAKLPIPLMGHITAIYNNNLFVFGGKNDNKFNDKFWKLPLSSFSLNMTNLDIINEPSNTDWIQISVKPPTYGSASNIGIGSNTFVCENQCSVLVNQYLYIFGSGSFALKQNNFINTVYRLDLSQDPPIFASENDLPITNLNNAKPFCVTSAMGNIYINTPFKTIQFDPMSIELQSIDIKYTPKYNFGCAPNFGEENIYLLGGNNDSYSYSIATNTNRYFQYSKDTSRNNIKCISLGLYSYNIECPGGLDMVNHNYTQNSIIWNTYNNSQTYVSLQTSVSQYGLEYYQFNTTKNYNSSIVLVIGGGNNERGTVKAIDTIQYAIIYENETNYEQQTPFKNKAMDKIVDRLNQNRNDMKGNFMSDRSVDGSIPMDVKDIQTTKKGRNRLNSDLKRRLSAHQHYFDDDDDVAFDDEQILDEWMDEWINSLSFDDAMYYYDLLKDDRDMYFDNNDDNYYNYGYDDQNNQMDNALTDSSTIQPDHCGRDISGYNITFTIPTTTKAMKSGYCKADINIDGIYGQQLYIKSKIQIQTPNTNGITILSPRPGTKKKPKNPTIEPNKKYIFKGVAWTRPTEGCANAPKDIKQYYLRFSEAAWFSTKTTHLISPADFEKLITKSQGIKIGGKSMSRPMKKRTSKPNKCLAFSGGGIRASIGAYFVLRRIQEMGTEKLKEIKCISVISGGSWGFILWLFEETAGSAMRNISKYIKVNGGWGPQSPHLFTKGNDARFHTKWSNEIEKYILNMTTLKGTGATKLFEGEIRKQLKKKGLGATTAYFVVESVDVSTPVRDDNKVEYCWFKASPTDSADVLQCSKDLQKTYPIQNCDIVKEKRRPWQTEHFRNVTLLDVLNYCSSAWATGIPYHVYYQTTSKLRCFGDIEKKVEKNTKPERELRFIDAGNTFNDPLLPYMIDDKYSSFGIWNFDAFSGTKEIKKLNKTLTDIGQGNFILTRNDSNTAEDWMEYELKRKDQNTAWDIIHCPLYGKNKKTKLIDKFPTIYYHKLGSVKKWGKADLELFESEWDCQVKTLLKNLNF